MTAKKKVKKIPGFKPPKLKPIDPNRRFQYNTNHQIIQKALWDFLLKEQRLPTCEQASQLTGLSVMTIKRHLPEISFQNFQPEYKPLTPGIVVGLAARARTGRAKEVQTWMQLIEGIVFENKSTFKFEDQDLDPDQKNKIAQALMADAKMQLKKLNE